MEFIIENWPIIVAALAAAAVLTAAVVTFAGLPTEAQLAKVKEWLLWGRDGGGEGPGRRDREAETAPGL